MEAYCILDIEDKFFSSKKNITVDFGKDDLLVTRLSDSLRQQTEGVSKSSTVVDALNYMASVGWELVHLMPFTIGGGSTDGNLNYLFKRII